MAALTGYQLDVSISNKNLTVNLRKNSLEVTIY